SAWVAQRTTAADGEVCRGQRPGGRVSCASPLFYWCMRMSSILVLPRPCSPRKVAVFGALGGYMLADHQRLSVTILRERDADTDGGGRVPRGGGGGGLANPAAVPLGIVWARRLWGGAHQSRSGPGGGAAGPTIRRTPAARASGPVLARGRTASGETIMHPAR